MLQFHVQSVRVKVVVKVRDKYLAARILEPGYGKKAGGLIHNVYNFMWHPCFQSSSLP